MEIWLVKTSGNLTNNVKLITKMENEHISLIKVFQEFQCLEQNYVVYVSDKQETNMQISYIFSFGFKC